MFAGVVQVFSGLGGYLLPQNFSQNGPVQLVISFHHPRLRQPSSGSDRQRRHLVLFLLFLSFSFSALVVAAVVGCCWMLLLFVAVVVAAAIVVVVVVAAAAAVAVVIVLVFVFSFLSWLYCRYSFCVHIQNVQRTAIKTNAKRLTPTKYTPGVKLQPGCPSSRPCLVSGATNRRPRVSTVTHCADQLDQPIPASLLL